MERNHLEEGNHLDRGARRSARGHLGRVRCQAIPHHVVEPDQGRRRLDGRSLAGRPQGAARRERHEGQRGRRARRARGHPGTGGQGRSGRSAAGPQGAPARRCPADRRLRRDRASVASSLDGVQFGAVLGRRRLGRLRAVQRGERPHARPDRAALVHGRCTRRPTRRHRCAVLADLPQQRQRRRDLRRDAVRDDRPDKNVFNTFQVSGETFATTTTRATRENTTSRARPRDSRAGRRCSRTTARKSSAAST